MTVRFFHVSIFYPGILNEISVQIFHSSFFFLSGFLSCYEIGRILRCSGGSLSIGVCFTAFPGWLCYHLKSITKSLQKNRGFKIFLVVKRNGVFIKPFSVQGNGLGILTIICLRFLFVSYFLQYFEHDALLLSSLWILFMQNTSCHPCLCSYKCTVLSPGA